MNYKQFLGVLHNCATIQNYVNSVNVGADVYHTLNQPGIKYGNMTVGISGFNRDMNDAYDTYNIVVYFADRLLQDDSNLNDVYAEANRALMGFAYSLSAVEGISVEGSYTINYFKQSFADYCAGAYMEMEVMVSLDINECDVEAYLTTPEDIDIYHNGTVELNGRFNVHINVPTSGGDSPIIMLSEGKVITKDEYDAIVGSNSCAVAKVAIGGRTAFYAPCGIENRNNSFYGLYFDYLFAANNADGSRMETYEVTFSNIEGTDTYRTVYTLAKTKPISAVVNIAEGETITSDKLAQMNLRNVLVILKINGGLEIPMTNLIMDRDEGWAVATGPDQKLYHIAYSLDSDNKVVVTKTELNNNNSYTKEEVDELLNNYYTKEEDDEYAEYVDIEINKSKTVVLVENQKYEKAEIEDKLWNKEYAIIRTADNINVLTARMLTSNQFVVYQPYGVGHKNILYQLVEDTEDTSKYKLTKINEVDYTLDKGNYYTKEEVDALIEECGNFMVFEDGQIISKELRDKLCGLVDCSILPILKFKKTVNRYVISNRHSVSSFVGIAYTFGSSTNNAHSQPAIIAKLTFENNNDETYTCRITTNDITIPTDIAAYNWEPESGSSVSYNDLAASVEYVHNKFVSKTLLGNTVYTKEESDAKYATKEEVPSLSGYATEQWVEDKGYLTEHQSLDGYATQEWVGEQGYLTEHQQLKTINGESIVGEGNIEIEGGSVEVVQDYGDSTTAVMSQNATTTAIRMLASEQADILDSRIVCDIATLTRGATGTTSFKTLVNNENVHISTVRGNEEIVLRVGKNDSGESDILLPVDEDWKYVNGKWNVKCKYESVDSVIEVTYKNTLNSVWKYSIDSVIPNKTIHYFTVDFTSSSFVKGYTTTSNITLEDVNRGKNDIRLYYKNSEVIYILPSIFRDFDFEDESYCIYKYIYKKSVFVVKFKFNDEGEATGFEVLDVEEYFDIWELSAVVNDKNTAKLKEFYQKFENYGTDSSTRYKASFEGQEILEISDTNSSSHNGLVKVSYFFGDRLITRTIDSEGNLGNYTEYPLVKVWEFKSSNTSDTSVKKQFYDKWSSILSTSAFTDIVYLRLTGGIKYLCTQFYKDTSGNICFTVLTGANVVFFKIDSNGLLYQLTDSSLSLVKDSDIVQTTGNSTTNIMSQSAVTSQLNEINKHFPTNASLVIGTTASGVDWSSVGRRTYNLVLEDVCINNVTNFKDMTDMYGVANVPLQIYMLGVVLSNSDCLRPTSHLRSRRAGTPTIISDQYLYITYFEGKKVEIGVTYSYEYGGGEESCTTAEVKVNVTEL